MDLRHNTMDLRQCAMDLMDSIMDLRLYKRDFSNLTE